MDAPTRHVVRAPLRISLAGGGTDLPAYADRFGGMVVSAAITLYATAHEAFGPFGDSSDLIRACAEEAAVQGWSQQALRVSCDAAPGTGLGSSSAVAVACLAALRGSADDPALLAKVACRVEMTRLMASIGWQDQYASAFGGLNAIRFAQDGTTTVMPIAMAPDAFQALEQRLLLFRDGISRHASAVLARQQFLIRTDDTTRVRMHAIRKLADEALTILSNGDLDSVGDLLHMGWQLKRRIDGITTPQIDEAYDVARLAGALGGKLCGAGGGGHLLLYVPEERQTQVTAALGPLGLSPVPFAFDRQGVRYD